MMNCSLFRTGRVVAGLLFLHHVTIQAQTDYTVLHAFRSASSVGVNVGELVRGPNGLLYGATSAGANGIPSGTIFRLDANGAAPQVILPFSSIADGTATQHRMAFGSDGALYLFYHSVGSSVDGGLVRLEPETSAFRILITAAVAQTRTWDQLVQGLDGRLYGLAGDKVVGINQDGTGFKVTYSDRSGAGLNLLLAGHDGLLYVTSTSGGQSGRGVIFRINPDGSGRAVLLDFGTLNFDAGSNPNQLIQGSDDFLYGTAMSIEQDGSFPNVGSPVFQLKTDGTGFKILGRLQNFPVPGPLGTLREGGVATSLIEAKDGFLYGATQDGATNRAGLVFRVSKDGNGVTNLLAFPSSYSFFDSGAGINRPIPKFLIEGTDGWIYGSTARNQIFRFRTDGSEIVTTMDLASSASAEGESPTGTLAAGADGWLFGTTRAGGASDLGTLFAVKADGAQFKTLHSFLGASEGSAPVAGLILGSDSKLYGTCSSNGVSDVGTVFRLNQDGTEFEVLRSFATTGGDGRYPMAPLLEASDSVLYGTTYFGGGAAAGSIFKLKKDGSEYSVVFRFTNNVSGANPSAGLIEGKDGRLYGSAETNGPSGRGVLYALAKDGTGFSVLHGFSAAIGLQKPQGSLLQGPDGTVYGTTAAGGSAGFGGVYRIQPDGTGFAVLHEFSAAGGDGRAPAAGVTFGPDELLYGVTQFGGGSINGSLFRLEPQGTDYVKLLAFGASPADGANPVGALVLGGDGALYGTTSGGGPADAGTLFRVAATTTPPQLTITDLGGQQVQLEWSPSNPAFQLQFSPDLAKGSNWQSLSDEPAVVGNVSRLAAKVNTAAGFYRLLRNK